VIKLRHMRWAGYVTRVSDGRGAYSILVGKSERKSPLGRPRRRWEDNVKMNCYELGGDLDWINLAQDWDM
jgi:hypothetical protein